MDLHAFLRAQTFAPDALCHEPVVARLKASGLRVREPSIRAARRAWRRGMLLDSARAEAARLGLVETREPEEGDPCVVRHPGGELALALYRAGDWFGLIGSDGRPVFARLDLVAAWRAPPLPES